MTSIRWLSSLRPWPWFVRARHTHRRRVAASACARAATVDVLAAPADDDLPRGCAWYPSSFELVQGTDVREDDVAVLACG